MRNFNFVVLLGFLGFLLPVQSVFAQNRDVSQTQIPGEIVVSTITKLRRPISASSFTALFIGQSQNVATSLSDAESRMNEAKMTIEKEFPGEVVFVDEGGTLENQNSSGSSILPSTAVDAHRLLTVKTRSTSKIARIIEIAFAAGAKEVSQPIYEAETELPGEGEIRDKLLKELRSKALASASSMGVSLGNLRSLSVSEEPEPRPIITHLTNVDKFSTSNNRTGRIALLAGQNIRLVATGIFNIQQ